MNKKATRKDFQPGGWRTTMPGMIAESERIEVEKAQRMVHEGDGPGAFSLLKRIVEDDSKPDEARYEAMRWMVSLYIDSHPDIDERSKESVVETLKNVVRSTPEAASSQPRRDASMALAVLNKEVWQGVPEALDFLLQLATDAGSSRQVRADVLLALAQTRSQEAIGPLARGILEGDSRLARGMREIDAEWMDKARAFLEFIEKLPITRADVNASDVVHALGPSWGEDPIRRAAEIGNFIIEQSRNRDERVAGVLSALLIETEGGDQNQAGHRINEYQKDHQISARELEGLRAAVGGTPALSGIMGVLQRDLQIYFQKPINELNESTRKSWEETIESARKGLVMRLWMSGTVFVIGIVLLLASSGRILLGGNSGRIEWQTLLPFLAGLGIMLLIIYTGPLKEIRQAVTDLGTASAAFIAYVHQVLETSHTFSFYYLHEKISFEHMEKSSEIIKKAMISTIDALSREALDSSERTIIEALNRLKEGFPGSFEKESVSDGIDRSQAERLGK